MYALAILTSAATAAATAALPYFHLGALDIGIPIQWFGMIVAVGVMVGATPLRRYAEWHGVSDDHIRGLLTWVMIAGFLGAHEFDVLAYRENTGDPSAPASWWFLPEALWPTHWPLVLRMWDGISSYGGFIGGGLGYALFVWWKRLPWRLFADITIVGLLPAFTIGRIGCTVVSDHIGAAVDPSSWYAFLAMDYPRKLNLAHLAEHYPGTSEMIRAWNLGLIEFLYLVPVNFIVLRLAFRSTKRMPAGFISVLTALLYAPVRFFLDFLRPEETDPRYLGLTFAQWSSILAFGVALYVARRILQNGAPAELVAPTSREAQERLRIILREDVDSQGKQAAEDQAAAERKKAAIAKARAERDREDAELAATQQAKAAPAVVDDDEADDGADNEADDGADNEADNEADDAKPVVPAAGKPAAAKPAAAKPAAAKPAAAKPAAAKPAAAKPAGSKPGNKNRNKNRKR